jgi:hypothetical protein
MTQIGQSGLRTLALLEQRRILVGLRLMRIAVALFTVKNSPRVVSPASRRPIFILRPVVLQRGQGIDQRPVYAEMLLRQQSGALCLR